MDKGTFFTLTADVSDATLAAMTSALRTVDSDVRYIFDDDGSPRHRARWDNHEEAVAYLSRQYPDTLITLWGEGEDCTDLWVKYFYNGRVQREWAQIIYAPFDVDGLDEPENCKGG